MKNRRTNIYNNNSLNTIVQDFRAGKSIETSNQQLNFSTKGGFVPGGIPQGNSKVQPAGTRISRVRAPLIGTRNDYTFDENGKYCNKNTTEIYTDSWAKCKRDDCNSRTSKPLIKSGMQYNSAATGNNVDGVKKYAFSYREYRRNLRNKTYQRKLSKFGPTGVNANEYAAGNGTCTSCDPIVLHPKNNLSKTTYKRSNKNFNSQGAVSSGTRLERLKLNTIQGSKIATKKANNACATNNCDFNSNQFTRGYRGSNTRFVTNPNEGGHKTRGFVPTRGRQAYLAHGRAIGNIFQKTQSIKHHNSYFGAFPAPVGAIKSCGDKCD